MSWRLRSRLLQHLRTALWPVPLACAAIGLVGGMLAWRLDRWGGWALLDYTPGGATAVTAAIVGAMISFVGIVFSVLLVAVTFASSQLTARALQLTLDDRGSKAALGVFVGTLLYAMVVMARIADDFVPQLALVGAAALILGSLLTFLLLLDHVGRVLRPDLIAARVGRQGRRILERIYPEAVGEPTDDAGAITRSPRGGPAQTVLHAGPPGVVLGYDRAGLVSEGQRARARLRLVPAVGDFVPTGAPLFHVVGDAAPVDGRRLAASVAIGRERLPGQDPTLAFRILVDVAIKALSPGINDPTSAVTALNHLHELLRIVGRRRLDVGEYRDAAGEARLTVKLPAWEDYVSLGVDEIRHYGAGSVQIARRLRAMLEDLLAVVPADRQRALQEQLELLARTVDRGFADAEDRDRAGVPDQQGLGSPTPGAWGRAAKSRPREVERASR
jgi:uncharacterized membrane protein